MRPKNDRLAYEILSAVAEIPCGKVSTYGQIARLIGREKNTRLVGSVLRHTADYGDYPCHRVVNAAASRSLQPRACLWAYTLPAIPQKPSVATVFPHPVGQGNQTR